MASDPSVGEPKSMTTNFIISSVIAAAIIGWRFRPGPRYEYDEGKPFLNGVVYTARRLTVRERLTRIPADVKGKLIELKDMVTNEPTSRDVDAMAAEDAMRCDRTLPDPVRIDRS